LASAGYLGSAGGFAFAATGWRVSHAFLEKGLSMNERPRFAMVEDDEPVAAVPVLDKAGLDRRAINRKACKHFSLLYNTIADRYGRSLIRDIGPGFRPNPDGVVSIRDALPRLITFAGPNHHDETYGGPGAWQSRGNGAHGSSVISLIQYMGGCDEKVATDWLRNWTDRIVELPK
jgi:hypothetical protein